MTGKRGLMVGKSCNLPLEVLILLPRHQGSDTKLDYPLSTNLTTRHIWVLN